MRHTTPNLHHLLSPPLLLMCYITNQYYLFNSRILPLPPCQPLPCTKYHQHNLFCICTQCDAGCGGGTQTRTVECQRLETGDVVSDDVCSDTRPTTTQACNTEPCPCE